MIRGIWQIGRGLLEGLDDPEVSFVEYLTEPLRRRWKEKPHLLILKIKSASSSFELEPLELNEGRLREYLWTGNAGANDDQDRVTTDHLEYLISQTIPNLLKEERLPEGELRRLLQDAFGQVYLDLGGKAEVFGESGGDQQYERYRYLMDLRRLGVDNAPTKEQMITLAKKGDTAKAAITELQNSLTEWIAKRTGLRPSDIALYTLEIDRTLLAKHREYRRYLFHEIVGEIFKGVAQGKCHLCGEGKPITDNTKFFNLLKFYNTDKLGFARDLNKKKGFYCRYTLCQDCYMALLAGDAFVRGSLSSNLARNNVYVIPSFHLDVKLSPERLKNWAIYLQSYLGKLISLEGWHKFQEELEDFRDYEEQKATFLLNFLFAQKRQSEVRIQRLVQDIPPSRLDLLVERRGKLKDTADWLWGESKSWDLSLGTIFWLFPVRKSQREVFNADVLNFYEALFTGKPVNLSSLVANFLEMARIYYRENFGPYVHTPPGNIDIALTQSLLQSTLLIGYLRSLGMLREKHRGGEIMDEFIEKLPTDVKGYISEMGYNGSQTGLFLLGYLIGQIGSEQHKASPGATKKPILNKLNFMAMPLPKVQRLSNEVFEKLEQYRILSYNEGIFAVMRGLLDKNRECWGLAPQENAYYILGGYAYATWKAIRGGA